MNVYSLRRCIGGLFVTAGAICTLAAQTPAPVEKKDNDGLPLKQSDDTPEKTPGYRAANSATATGIGTKIMDVPLPINVLTKDFLRDTFRADTRGGLEAARGVP